MFLDETKLCEVETSLVENGFSAIEDFLNPDELAIMKAEWSALYRGFQNYNNTLGDLEASERLIVDFGCVLEPMAGPIDVDTRKLFSTSMSTYYNLRSDRSWNRDKNTDSAIWCTLSNVKIQQILDRIFGDSCFLYNEQYIAKPENRHTGTAFGWHRDNYNAQSRDAFVSMWFALDDVDSINGGVVIKSYNAGKFDTGKDISVCAGGLIILAHDVEHCSTPNYSHNPRVAYMAQFSQVPMLDDCGDLVAFAVPVEFRIHRRP